MCNNFVCAYSYTIFWVKSSTCQVYTILWSTVCCGVRQLCRRLTCIMQSFPCSACFILKARLHVVVVSSFNVSITEKGLIQFLLKFLFKWYLHVNFFIEKAGSSCLFGCNVLNEQTHQKNQEPFVCVSKFPFDYLISVSNKFRKFPSTLQYFFIFVIPFQGSKNIWSTAHPLGK